MTDQAPASTSSAELFGSDRMWGLKELPLPEAVSWWPQTAGWTGLGAVLLLMLTWVGWRVWRRHQRNAYRREGLATLEVMASSPDGLKELPFLLRKAALQAAPRKEVASLRGEDWLAWLNKSAGVELFSAADGRALDRLTFGSEAAPDLDAPQARRLIEASKIWMRSHRAAV